MSEVKYAEDRPKTAGTATSGQEKRKDAIWAVKKTATTGYVQKRHHTVNVMVALTSRSQSA